MKVSTIATEDTHNASRPASPAEQSPSRADYVASDEDVRLMLRFGDGDQRAFDELVRRHKQRVFGVLGRLTNNREDVEDLSQEVFLRVFRSRSSYRPTARFSTWLYRIATNLAINAAKSRKKLRIFTAVSDDANISETAVDENTPQPDKQMQNAELAAEVRKAIDSLPDSQKTAIILRRYEQLSYDQIADIMNLSSPAVKSLLSRARVNLKKQLAAHIKR